MRLMEWIHLVDNHSYTASREFAVVEQHLREAIEAVHWPVDSEKFVINPTKHGNGVVPIKEGFVTVLARQGWSLETKDRRFDAMYDFGDGRLPFGVEWETGNISSSHRAINRIALATLERDVVGGVLVVPTRALYPYLTDRIGNEQELRRYFPLWQRWGKSPEFNYLGIITVEHHELDTSVPLIRKGTDGRALV